MEEVSKFTKSLRNPWQWMGLIVILGVIGFLIISPIFWHDDMLGHEIPMLQKPRTIGLLLFSYANDHNGKYPSGASSTEVFQKLIDEKYAKDPAIFYYEMPGKTKPTSNKLRPKNVSYDITAPVDDHDSDYLPMAFLTGYKIQYVPNGSAVPLRALASQISRTGSGLQK